MLMKIFNAVFSFCIKTYIAGYRFHFPGNKLLVKQIIFYNKYLRLLRRCHNSLHLKILYHENYAEKKMLFKYLAYKYLGGAGLIALSHFWNLWKTLGINNDKRGYRLERITGLNLLVFSPSVISAYTST